MLAKIIGWRRSLFGKGESKSIVKPEPITDDEPGINIVKENKSFDVESFIYVRSNPTLENSLNAKAEAYYSDLIDDKARKSLIDHYIEMELSYLRNEPMEFLRRVSLQIEGVMKHCLFDRKDRLVMDKEMQESDARYLDYDGNYIIGKLGEAVFGNKRYNSSIKNKMTLGEPFKIKRIDETSEEEVETDIKKTYVPSVQVEKLFCYYFFNSPNAQGLVTYANPFYSKLEMTIFHKIKTARDSVSHGWIELKEQEREFIQSLLDGNANLPRLYFDALHQLNIIRFAERAQVYLSGEQNGHSISEPPAITQD